MSATIESKMNSNFPKQVQIVEVGPRDGLQNEETILDTADKVQFIEMLANAGYSSIEVSSFVNPARIPQLADAAEVFAQLPRKPGVRYAALVPNRKGLDRAIAANVDAIAFFTAASETFTDRNIGMTIDGSLDVFRSMMTPAKAAGMWIRAYVSTAFFCPYEGRIQPPQVVPVVKALLEMGVDEISIGDTVGWATPTDVTRLTESLLPHLPLNKFAYHFHDTRGAALANVLTALNYGIHIFDGASGGSGGCPFAPGAAGNLSTEDLIGMLHGMGIETGVNLNRALEAAWFLEAKLGKYLPGKWMQSAPDDMIEESDH